MCAKECTNSENFSDWPVLLASWDYSVWRLLKIISVISVHQSLQLLWCLSVADRKKIVIKTGSKLSTNASYVSYIFPNVFIKWNAQLLILLYMCIFMEWPERPKFRIFCDWKVLMPITSWNNIVIIFSYVVLTSFPMFESFILYSCWSIFTKACTKQQTNIIPLDVKSKKSSSNNSNFLLDVLPILEHSVICMLFCFGLWISHRNSWIQTSWLCRTPQSSRLKRW